MGDLACLAGAAGALGPDPARSYLAVSVVFRDADDAQRVDVHEPGVVGTAEDTTYSLDRAPLRHDARGPRHQQVTGPSVSWRLSP